MRRSWRAMFLFVFLAAVLCYPAPPAVAAVIRVTSVADTNDGNCDTHCSVREAIIAANTTPGADTVTLPTFSPRVFDLTLAGANENASATGDLDVTSQITIVGNGHQIHQATGDRVFHVGPGGVLTLSNASITGGKETTGGGGVFNQGTLTLSSTSVVGNNTNDTTSGNAGGGIYTSQGTVNITSSNVSGNESDGDGGGGIAVWGGTVNVTSSTISGNAAGFAGGGIGVFAGAVIVTSSTISGNTAGGHGGGLMVDAAIVGGAAPATAIVRRTTLSGNSARISGGGIFGGDSTTVSSATVTGNQADSDNNGTGNGGGVHREAGTLSIGNTILFGNVDNGAGATPSNPDCSGAITSSDYNILGTDLGCGGSITGAHDDFGDPGFLALGSNGGPTQTHALSEGGSAIDHGPTDAPACSETDQRGVPRPVGAACDTGAYEFVKCRNRIVNVVGTSGKNKLRGTAGDDGILGFGGNDKLIGGGGNDGLCAGPGKDTLLGGRGNDTLDGSRGTDVCKGQAGRDSFRRCETQVQ